MEWMIDTANLEDVQSALDTFPIVGVTTNPTILKAELPINYLDHLRALRRLCGPRSLHVQLGAETCQGMLEETAYLRQAIDPDIYVKVPVTEEGLKAIGRLSAQGVHVTATAIYYPLQGMLAAAAGAEYLAPYCNRMEQNEIDFGKAIGQIRRLIDRDGYKAKILAASFKNAGQVVKAIDSGAHAVTAQPATLRSVLKSALVVDAVRVFNADQRKVKGE